MSFQEFFQQNMIFFIGAAAVLAVLIFTEIRQLKTGGITLTPTLLTQKVNAGAKLIDLRRHDDFRDGHIAGAKNIQPADLANHIAGFGDKDCTIVLYCYSGAFSAKGVSQIKKAGYADVYHLSGGINAWKNENLPLVKV